MAVPFTGLLASSCETNQAWSNRSPIERPAVGWSESTPMLMSRSNFINRENLTSAGVSDPLCAPEVARANGVVVEDARVEVVIARQQTRTSRSTRSSST